MLSNYRSGLKRWSRTLQEIWIDPKVTGIERWTRLFLYSSRILSISEHLSFFLIGPKYTSDQYRRDLWLTDTYVVGKTIVVGLLAFLPASFLPVGAAIATYFLVEMYSALLN